MPVRTGLILLRGELSRQRAAEMMGITPQMLGYIERGQRNPSMHLTARMAKAYGVSIETIVQALMSEEHMTM